MRRSGLESSARIFAPSFVLMIPGQTASATTSPLWMRWPLIRGEASIRRRLCGDQAPPLADATPRSFRSLAIDRTGSPASSRFTHSRTIAASADPDRDLVGLVAVRPAAATGDAALERDLLMLAPDAAALIVAFLLRHRRQDTSLELPVRARQINVAARRGDVRHTELLAEIDELLQLARLPMQPIEVIDQQPIQRPRAQRGQAALVLRPMLAAPGADVIVDKPLNDLPAPTLRQTLAILELPLHTQSIPLPVRRDPRIRANARNRQPSSNSHSGNIQEHSHGPACSHPNGPRP